MGSKLLNELLTLGFDIVKNPLILDVDDADSDNWENYRFVLMVDKGQPVTVLKNRYEGILNVSLPPEFLKGDIIECCDCGSGEIRIRSAYTQPAEPHDLEIDFRLAARASRRPTRSNQLYEFEFVTAERSGVPLCDIVFATAETQIVKYPPPTSGGGRGR